MRSNDSMEVEIELKDLQDLIAREVTRQLEGHTCGSCSTGTTTAADGTPMMKCGTDRRKSSIEYRRAMRKRTGTARYTGAPLQPGASVEFQIDPYDVGWKLGPFNFTVEMDTNGNAADITVALIVDEEIIHEFAGDEYTSLVCCAYLKRCIGDCLGYETPVTIRMTHGGKLGDPDLKSGRMNYERIFENDPLWGAKIGANKYSKDGVEQLVQALLSAAASGRGLRLGAGC